MHPMPHDYKIECNITKPTIDINTKETFAHYKADNESYERRLQQLFLQVEDNKNELSEILRKTHVDAFNAQIGNLQTQILTLNTNLMLEIDAINADLRNLRTTITTTVADIARTFRDYIIQHNIDTNNTTTSIGNQINFVKELAHQNDENARSFDHSQYRLTERIYRIERWLDDARIPIGEPPNYLRQPLRTDAPPPPVIPAPPAPIPPAMLPPPPPPPLHVPPPAPLPPLPHVP